jgi:RHS repeat-associated protein
VSGYASGNLTFTANRWGGTANPGEFEISGTQFTPHRLVTTRKYYYAGGQRIAMRESGTLHYLFSDHLGSTGVSYRVWDGQTVRQLYKPWGEARYTSGSLPTKYTFTGQYSNVNEFGLLFFNARWVDPALGRFAQADSMVPNPGNPLDWDRYSYVRNNPLRYVDPSGHFCEMVGSNEICSADDDSNGHWLPFWTPSELVNNLWGWSIEGVWETSESSAIVSAGFAIQNYINKAGGNGQEWIRTYIGKVRFKRDVLSSMFFSVNKKGGVVMWRSVIRLPASGWDVGVVVHELGHVLDNKWIPAGFFPETYTGGGLSDAFLSGVGGDPVNCRPRFQCSTNYIQNHAGPESWPQGEYGNNSVADDFAEAFRYSIQNPTLVPLRRRIWMESFISLSVTLVP